MPQEEPFSESILTLKPGCQMWCGKRSHPNHPGAGSLPDRPTPDLPREFYQLAGGLVRFCWRMGHFREVILEVQNISKHDLNF
jgi:hypothetical protein